MLIHKVSIGTHGYNNPVKFVDRDGHFPLVPVLLLLAVGYVAYDYLAHPDIAYAPNDAMAAGPLPPSDLPENDAALCSFCSAAEQGQWGAAIILGAVEATPLDEIPGVNKCVNRVIDDISKVGSDLFAFGRREMPRAPRPGIDIFPDSSGIIEAQSPPLPHGASTFGDVSQAPLTGQYHRLPAGTKLPSGLGVVADGIDVNPISPHPPTHHTIYPTRNMHVDEFTDLFERLPWEYAGKKK